MSISKRHLLKSTALVLFVPAAHTANAQVSVATAINRAARFRALSQRCAKAYCQLQQEILPDSARDVMASAQRLIQIGFEDLARAKLPASTTGQLNDLQKESNLLNTMLTTAPTQTQTQKVSQQADRMLVAADQLAVAIETSTNQQTGKLINLSGRQRMLSQRLAKNYFLSAAGGGSKAMRELQAADRADFKSAMLALNAAPISTASIRNELQVTQSQWVFFDAALDRKPDLMALRDIATTSERLLEASNNLTAYYELALKDVLGSI